MMLAPSKRQDLVRGKDLTLGPKGGRKAKISQNLSDEDMKLFSGICSLEYDILKVPKHEDAKQISRKSDHLTSNTSEISFGMWNLECDIGMV